MLLEARAPVLLARMFLLWHSLDDMKRMNDRQMFQFFENIEKLSFIRLLS